MSVPEQRQSSNWPAEGPKPDVDPDALDREIAAAQQPMYDRDADAAAHAAAETRLLELIRKRDRLDR